jgi:lia operon protein LiaF
MNSEPYHSHSRKNTFWAIIIILIGVILLLSNLDIISIKHIFRNYWPVLIIFWGLYLIVRRERYHFDKGIAGDKELVCESGQAIYSNVFGDLEVEIKTQEFEVGNINNTFGDIHLDLSKVNIRAGEKNLDVHGVFGDTKIMVPQNIEYAINASVTAGDIKIMGKKIDGFSKALSHKSKNYENAKTKLNIHISQIFGTIKVR